MAKEATVTKLPDPDLDTSKPIELEYWALPNGQFFGNSVQRLVKVGGVLQDGVSLSGKVAWIRAFPSGLVLIAVDSGWQPGKLEQVTERRYMLFSGHCHGVSV